MLLERQRLAEGRERADGLCNVADRPQVQPLGARLGVLERSNLPERANAIELGDNFFVRQSPLVADHHFLHQLATDSFRTVSRRLFRLSDDASF